MKDDIFLFSLQFNIWPI